MPIIGEAAINLIANTRPLSAGLGRVSGIVRKGLAPIAAIVGTASAALGGFGIGFGIKLAAEMEQTEIAFESMLGSAEKAKRVIGDLKDFSDVTPFEPDDVIAAGRSLIAFKEPTEQLVNTLTRIGNVSAGLKIPLGDLTEIYGKARVNGRLMMEDINQLTGRGIPIIGELAKQFGVTEGEVRNLVSTGKVGFKNLEQAFADLTGEGGMFFDLMAKQSKSTLGLWSTQQGAMKDIFRDIGSTLIEELNGKEALESLITNTRAFRDTFIPTFRSSIRWAVAFAGGIKQVAVSTRDWYEDNKVLIGGIAKTAAAVTALSLGVEALVGSTGLLGGSLFALATSPIALVTAGIGGIVAAFAYMSGTGETVIERLSTGFGFLNNTISKVFQNIETISSSWSRSIDIVIERVAGMLITTTGSAERAWFEFTGNIKSVWYETISALAEGWENFTDIFRSGTQFIAEKLAWVMGKMKGLTDDEIQQHIDATINTNMNDASGGFAAELQKKALHSSHETAERIHQSLNEEQSNLANLENTRIKRDKEYADKLANANGTLLDDFKSVLGKMGLGGSGTGDVIEEFKAAIAAARGEMPALAGVGDSGFQAPDLSSNQKIQTVGLTDMFNRIQTAISPSKDDAQKKTEQHTKSIADESKKQTKVLGDIAKKITPTTTTQADSGYGA